jgi:pimeloyl-ACP methyl ester carboxylesterase
MSAETDTAVRAGAIPLAYEDQGSGVSLLFLHGLTFDRTSWRPIINRLAGEVRTIAIDLPGHGQTGGSASSVREVAARVHNLACELGAERPLIVGHSISGAIASIYAGTFPTLGVVNVDQPADIRAFSQLVRKLWPALSGPGFAEAFEMFQRSMGLENVPQPLRSQILASQRRERDIVLSSWAEFTQVDPDEMQTQIEDDMRQISCPYLFVSGRPLASAERRYMLDRVNHLQITEWPDAGHFVHLVDADRFAERLRLFITFCSQSALPIAAGVTGNPSDSSLST